MQTYQKFFNTHYDTTEKFFLLLRRHEDALTFEFLRDNWYVFIISVSIINMKYTFIINIFPNRHFGGVITGVYCVAIKRDFYFYSVTFKSIDDLATALAAMRRVELPPPAQEERSGCILDALPEVFLNGNIAFYVAERSEEMLSVIDQTDD